MIWIRKFIAGFLAVGAAMCATQAACANLWGTFLMMVACSIACAIIFKLPPPSSF